MSNHQTDCDLPEAFTAAQELRIRHIIHEERTMDLHDDCAPDSAYDESPSTPFKTQEFSFQPGCEPREESPMAKIPAEIGYATPFGWLITWGDRWSLDGYYVKCNACHYHQDVRGAELPFVHEPHCHNESQFGDYPFHDLAKYLLLLKEKVPTQEQNI